MRSSTPFCLCSGLFLAGKLCVGSFLSHPIPTNNRPSLILRPRRMSSTTNAEEDSKKKIEDRTLHRIYWDGHHHHSQGGPRSAMTDSRRRSFFHSFGLSMVGGMIVVANNSPRVVHADDAFWEQSPEIPDLPKIEMKEFVDPAGYFSIQVPKHFFAIRRSIKGDLPDPKTGQGRRGSSIFTAGDMNKAELVAIERFPTKSLLEENGIEASGDLSSFTSLGDPAAVASLLSQRRDRDKAGTGMSNTQLVPNSIYLTSDGLELSFRLKTEIEVQKPELLLEQYGVSELYRITAAKASLASRDGNLMAVYASALETDFDGPDGRALQDVVNSFEVTDQSGKS